MFKNIVYNKFNNKIYLWEVFNGTANLLIEDYERDYYIRDETGLSEIKDIHGNPVERRIAKHKDEMKNYKEIGFQLSESDLSPEVKFLQSRYKDVDLKPNMKDFNICYMDIEIASENEFPKPEEAKFPINLITIKSSKTNQVMTFGLEDYTGKDSSVEAYYKMKDEKDLLIRFVKYFRKQEFDIITGWNVYEFDIKYIMNRIINLFGEEAKLEKQLSPIKQTRKLYNGNWIISGVSVLDYLELYKKFTFVTEESYTLQSIGMKVLGEGKVELDGQVNTIYKTNWNQFVEYNIQDVILIEKMEEKLKFIELAITLSYQALVPFESVLSSIATIEGYMLRHLHKNNIVMPDRAGKVRDWWVKEEFYRNEINGKVELQNINSENKIEEYYVKGGHVEANKGFYENVLSFDVTSLYPHMIIQYNISPETKVIKPSQKQIEEMDLIKSEINGVYYKRKKGILPQIVESIFNERKAFRKEMAQYGSGSQEHQYYNSQQQIRKILINSMYGVLINEYFHFYDIDNARAITRGGRVLVRYLSENTNKWFKKEFHKIGPKIFPGSTPQKIEKNVISVIDTDSNYVCLNEIKRKYAMGMEFKDFAKIMENLLQDFYSTILQIKADKNKMEQVINFKREGVITKQLVVAKKKYLVELIQSEEEVFDKPKLKATGIEIKRSDSPLFCREWIEKSIENIFEYLDKEKNIEFLKKIFKKFKKQHIDLIASNGGVNGYNKYCKYNPAEYVEGRIEYESKTPMRNKASICYNYLVKKFDLPLMEVADGSKVKYIRVFENNITKNDAIAWIGSYPEEFKDLFKIDYDEQFNKTFLQVLTRIHNVLGWCDLKNGIQLNSNKMSSFLM